MKSKKFKDEFKAIIPANVDPIKLADKIKKDMSIRFLKEIKMLRQRRLKSRLAQRSQSF
mgnify:FL=1